MALYQAGRRIPDTRDAIMGAATELASLKAFAKPHQAPHVADLLEQLQMVEVGDPQATRLLSRAWGWAQRLADQAT